MCKAPEKRTHCLCQKYTHDTVNVGGWHVLGELCMAILPSMLHDMMKTLVYTCIQTQAPECVREFLFCRVGISLISKHGFFLRVVWCSCQLPCGS